MFGKKIHQDEKNKTKSITSTEEKSPKSEIDISKKLSVDEGIESELLKAATGRTSFLIQEILKLDEMSLNPHLDYSHDRVIYPILSKIGEELDNTMFLDDLVRDGIFDKEISEKILVCPDHPNSISTSIRIFCPNCKAMNLEKLNLFEHKKCGHISESNAPFITKCDKCVQDIENFNDEFKILAMWYQCFDCKEKFDNATMLIHCRKHNHDFDSFSGKFRTLYSYKLKTLHISKNSDTTQIKNEIVKLFSGFNFITNLNEYVMGKSGNMHEIPIHAVDKLKNHLLIFIKNRFEGIDESDMSSILIPKLDIDPKYVVLVTPSKVRENVEILAKHYGIFIVTAPNFSEILGKVEQLISTWYVNENRS